jgi:single-strand DNA-binding protein
MAQAAQITFSGVLGTDPELRFTAAGIAVTTINVAVGERRQNKTGDWEDAGTSWFRVTVWNKPAEHAAESLKRGNRVMVTGVIRQTEYTDKDGARRTSWEVTADEIGLSLKFGPATLKRPGGSRSTDSPSGESPEPEPYPDGTARFTNPGSKESAPFSTVPRLQRVRVLPNPTDD